MTLLIWRCQTLLQQHLSCPNWPFKSIAHCCGYIYNNQTQTWFIVNAFGWCLFPRDSNELQRQRNRALTTRAALFLPGDLHSARQSARFINSHITLAALPPSPKHRNQSFSTLDLVHLSRGKKKKLKRQPQGGFNGGKQVEGSCVAGN